MAPVITPTSTPENLSLPEMLRVMDMARAMRDERTAVERELNAEETRRILRDKLLESAKLTGETVTPAEVDAAIEQYFNSLHTYRDPPLGWSSFLAHLYIRRWSLLWGSLGLIFVVAALTRTVPDMSPAARQERVKAQALQTLGILLTRADSGAATPAAREDVARVRRDVDAAAKTGDAQQLHDLEVRLETLLRNQVEQAETIRRVKNLQIRLEAVAGEPAAKDQAAQSGREVEALSQTGDLPQLHDLEARLETLVRNLTAQRETLPRLDKLLVQVEAEAVEPAAKEQAAQLRREVEALRQTRDLSTVAALESRLGNLRLRLSEEYEVRIVADRARKSGIDIYYDDPKIPGVQREPSWFAIVEAWNPQGQRLTRRIKNDKDGKTYDVTTWGEKVPREVFERLKADKKDGVLNETLFAVKRRGYLEEEPRLPGLDGRPLPSTGRITRW